MYTSVQFLHLVHHYLFILRVASPNKISTGFKLFVTNCSKPLLWPLHQIVRTVAVLQHFVKCNEIILKHTQKS